MVFTPGGEICALSMLMANMSCLALSSYFSTILPTKRSLLTRFNTVFVLAMTAWVNALVRMSSFLSIGPYIISLPHWPLHSHTFQLTILNSVRRHLDICDLFTDLDNAGNHLPGMVILVNMCIKVDHLPSSSVLSVKCLKHVFPSRLSSSGSSPSSKLSLLSSASPESF